MVARREFRICGLSRTSYFGVEPLPLPKRINLDSVSQWRQGSGVHALTGARARSRRHGAFGGWAHFDVAFLGQVSPAMHQPSLKERAARAVNLGGPAQGQMTAY
jgi:hypothetical protein